MYTDYNDENDEKYYIDDDNNNNQFDKEKLKKIVFYVLVGVIGLILFIALVKGCSKPSKPSGGVSSNTEVKTPLVSFGRKNISLDKNESKQLEVEVFQASVSNPVVTWSSSDSSIVSVNDQGYITAKKEGTVKIEATYTEKGDTYTDVCEVTVTSKNVPLESISLGQQEVTLKVGASMLLQVTLTPSDAKVNRLSYESASPEIASVDDNGYVKALKEGTTSVTVKNEDGSKSASITINVTDDKNVQDVSIEPTSFIIMGIENSLVPGSTGQIKYQVLPTNSTNTKISWSSTDTDIATVDQDGIISAYKTGKCTIIGTTENGISDKYEITVESAAVSVSSVAIDGSTSLTMRLGDTKQLTYRILPDNATNKNVTFMVSNSNVLFVDTNGLISAIGPGYSVAGVVTEDGKKMATVNIAVKDTSDPGNVDESTGKTDDSTGDDKKQFEFLPTTNCSADSFSIKSNQSGATVSNTKFENATAFTGSNPGLRVTKYEDCITSGTYSLWYNSDKSKLNTSSTATETGDLPKLYEALSLKHGDGYYYIEIKINNQYSKKYYAIVKNGSSSGGNDSNTDTKTNDDKKVTTTCSKDSILVESNQSGAKTSNVKFANTKAFTGSDPGLNVTKYDDCIKKATYSMWYNSSSSKLSKSKDAVKSDEDFPKINETLKLSNGNGYYYIELKITSTDGKTYSKEYYAYVKKSDNSSSDESSGNDKTNGGSDSTGKQSNPGDPGDPSSSCIAANILQITHDASSGKISTKSFDAAYSQRLSGSSINVKVDSFDSNCFKNPTYSVYYGNNKNTSTTMYSEKTLKTVHGSTIVTMKDAGYYKIVVKAKLKSNGKEMTKTYYAYKAEGSSSTLSSKNKDLLTISKSVINKGSKFSVKTSDSRIKDIVYCVATFNCNPEYGKKDNSYVYYGYRSVTRDLTFNVNYGNSVSKPDSNLYYTGKYVCFRGSTKRNDNASLIGNTQCKSVDNNNLSSKSSNSNDGQVTVTLSETGKTTGKGKELKRSCKYSIGMTKIDSYRYAYSYFSETDCKNKLEKKDSYKSYNTSSINKYSYIYANDVGMGKVWMCFQGYKNGNKAGSVVTKSITAYKCG